ncbi:Stress protein [Frankia sp. AiPs1]|uniref:TerD family protein n=1 Tax=Frankia sp. AiPa1 TaxID=573492 RepID=UPI002551CBB7|nr:TerD family protein [Frankia sp. AiPa1]
MAPRVLPKGGNIALADLGVADQSAPLSVALGWDDRPELADLELDAVIAVTRPEGAGPAGPASPGGTALLLAQQVPNPEERPTATPPPRPLVGDAERLVVTLGAIPSDVERIQFGVAVYDAVGRHRTFRSVHGAYLRLLGADGTELVRCCVDAETGRETAMVFGELYRHPRGWKIRCVAQGYTDGLTTLAAAGDAAHPVDVAGFLARSSPARSHRTLTAHLHPQPQPQAVPAPSPSRAGPAAHPAAGDPVPVRPVPVHPEPVRPVPVRPEPVRPVPVHPEPVRPKPAARRSSALDLGEAPGGRPEPGAEFGSEPRVGSAGRGPSPAVSIGVRSSRHRQRTERIDTLDDDHPATIWTPDERGSGAMTVTLRWSALTTRTGLPRPSNIHLGCLWQADTGSAGVLQDLDGLVSAPGHGARRQVLRLGRREERDGQTIFVDLASLPTFRRFFVFAYGLRAAPDWAALRVELAVAAGTGEHLTIRLGEAPGDARLCVVASFHVVEDDLVIRRENDFLTGTQADAAARYGWTLEWGPDGTTPRAPR